MKILYVITKANWGGAQKYVFELAAAAKEAGHEVAVAYGEAGELVARLTAEGVPCLPIAGLARDLGVGRELRAFAGLRALLKRERPDVVHLNSSKAGALGALAARFAKVPRIIFTAHGWAFNEARPLWQRAAIRIAAWVTVLLAHETICVSRAIQRDLRFAPFTHSRLCVIYNGVAMPAYKQRGEAREALWAAHESGTWIGMLSELHPTKRVEDALEAFALVRQKHPETRLVILGDGEERARLEWLIRESNLAGYAHLAGFVEGGDSYLRAFDLFLHASRSEALALAVIEAGFAGLPVVATAVGGIPEVIDNGKSGLLVPPEDPRALAAALVALIEDPARAERLGGALAETCRVRFDRARMTRETLAAYARGSH